MQVEACRSMPQHKKFFRGTALACPQVPLHPPQMLGTLDDIEQKVKVVGYYEGLYVRIVLEGIPAEFLKNFNPLRPVVMGGRPACVRPEAESCIGPHAQPSCPAPSCGPMTQSPPLLLPMSFWAEVWVAEVPAPRPLSRAWGPKSCGPDLDPP